MTDIENKVLYSGVGIASTAGAYLAFDNLHKIPKLKTFSAAGCEYHAYQKIRNTYIAILQDIDTQRSRLKSENVRLFGSNAATIEAECRQKLTHQLAQMREFAKGYKNFMVPAVRDVRLWIGVACSALALWSLARVTGVIDFSGNNKH